MNNSLQKLILKLAGIGALLAACAQTVLYLIGYDEALHLYERDFSLPGLIYGVFFLLISAGFVFFCLQKKDSLPTEIGRVDRTCAFFSLFSGILLLAAAVYNVMRILDTPPEIPSTIRIFALAMTIPAACYFIASAWIAKPSRPLTSLLGMFVLCWLALYLMSVYFELDSSLKSPERILRQLGLALLMVHFLYEIRYLLGIPMPRLYFATGCAAILMVGLSALPDAVVTLLQKRAITDNSMFSLTMTAMGLYIFARMLSTLRGEAMEFSPAEEAAPEEEAADE